MLEKHIETIIKEKFEYEFSPSQQEAVRRFIAFFLHSGDENLFLLKGFAGTGKTSLVAAFVNTLVTLGHPVVLLAPTGRAAKVFSSYAGQAAFTIHKKIYRRKTTREGTGLFNLGYNTHSRVLFFVDEASMIASTSSDNNFGSGSLLEDLFEFVYNGRHNRLVLIGDTAQLPPIGTQLSPALDPAYLQLSFGIDVIEAHLTDIMRQTEESGILYNATRVRGMLGSTTLSNLQIRVRPFPDVIRLSGGELLEELDQAYSTFGIDETVVICRSNKRANRFNAGIRSRILYREEEFSNGDRVMIVKNNYFWGEGNEKIDFLANGEIATVARLGVHKELYGFRFARATLNFSSIDEEISAWVMLDTLSSEQPALSSEENKRFYLAVEQDYQHIKSKQKRFKQIQENEYFNALQIKFAYAVTCHKAQGGQWDAVFIDNAWLPSELHNDEYWRWLYTAITRARCKLYFINYPNDHFHPDEQE